jgi:hypothetical protein
MGNQTIWGPYFWKLIHNITVLYPENPSDTDKLMIIKFINSYLYLLPCGQCEAHFRSNLISFPLTNEYLVSRSKMVLWGIKMHNIVNTMLRKKTKFAETSEIVNEEIKKYQSFSNINTIDLFKNVLSNAINNKASINSNIQSAFADLFYSVCYFLKYKNIDIIKNLEQRKISIVFDDKNKILRIAQNIK